MLKLESQSQRMGRSGGGQAVGKSAKVKPQEQPDEEAATGTTATGYLPPAHS